ncbi:Putative deoxyribonuclease RhsC [Pseudomonas fluorescens]|uniref:Deoxyribonuclease RhsC n=1 Tax=Pseudomonas fluorescens TaxID=294 RepID=A0A5E6UCT1_PSEFL|nr:Putative deoxyribonuclease RhsC [Pseudomonas fluorescens]
MLTAYERDAAGRLLIKTLPDGLKVTYQYDRLGRLIGVDDGQQHPLAFEYDRQDRLITEHQGWGTLRYRYDACGQLKRMRLPDNSVLDYRHAKGGALTDIDLNGTPLTRHVYKSGREQQRQQGLLLSEYSYDDQGRLLAHAVGHQRDALYRRDYAYNANGNLAHIADSRHGQRTYGYDALDRLIRVRHSRDELPESFAHDPAGNLLMQDRPGPSQIQGNRLLMQGDRHYDYDAFGNLIRERRGRAQTLVTEYRYDCQHRLIGLTRPDGQTATYAYDAFGRRIRKTVGDAITEFFWQGDHLVAESSESEYRSYVYEPGTFRPLALLDGKGPKKACPFYYQLDHLGTPQELTDYSGDIVWSAQYDAYGKVAALTLAGEDYLNQPLRFQGQYFDGESGLHYNRHRYYDPRLGRYLTPDLIKLAGGLNQYQYVPNPTGWVDPLGLACTPCPGAIQADGPYSEIVPGGGLAAHEALGGHLIIKHVGRTDIQLAQRLQAEPNIPAASTFMNRAEAEAAVSEALSSNSQKVTQFLNSNKGKTSFSHVLGRPVGVSMLSGLTHSQSASKLLLVLKKDPALPLGYFLLTGFPEL